MRFKYCHSVGQGRKPEDDTQFCGNACRAIATYLAAHLYPFWSRISKSYARRFAERTIREHPWLEDKPDQIVSWAKTGNLKQRWKLTKSPSWLRRFYLEILVNPILQAHLLRRMINRKKEWMDAWITTNFVGTQLLGIWIKRTWGFELKRVWVETGETRRDVLEMNRKFGIFKYTIPY